MCKDKKFEKQLSENLRESAFIGLNINYHDSIYRVIIRHENIYLEKRYPRTFPKALIEEEVLTIDSATFSLLKPEIVSSQHRIDSIYAGNINNLLNTFFDERGVLLDSLSYEEEKYLIDILLQNKILTNVDCETGILFICE